MGFERCDCVARIAHAQTRSDPHAMNGRLIRGSRDALTRENDLHGAAMTRYVHCADFFGADSYIYGKELKNCGIELLSALFGLMT
jgi:hypothetical protein